MKELKLILRHAGTVLLGLAPSAATFLRAVSIPSLECSGTMLCSGSALIGGPLFVGGTDVMAAIASAGSGTGDAPGVL